MTNKIINITNAIEAALRDAGIRYTGVLPEAIDRMGNLYPMGFVSLGTDETLIDNGGRLTQQLNLDVYIISQHGVNKMRQHCDLLYAAISAVMSSSTLSTHICMITNNVINWSAFLPYTTMSLGSLDMISSFNLTILYSNTR